MASESSLHTSTYPWVLCALLLFLSLITYSENFPRQTNFIANMILAGLFFYANITPYFDPTMKLFMVMCNIILAVGSLVGGVLGILLPRISASISLGLYLAILASALMSLTVAPSAFFENFLLLLITIGSAVITWLISNSYEKHYLILRDSLAIGLMFSVSVDLLYKQDLTNFVVALLGLESQVSDACTSSCDISSKVILWIAVSIVTAVYSHYRSGFLRNCFSRSSPYSNNYVPLSTFSTTGEVTIASFKQRTFSYPDTLISNYIDPDDVPELLKPYAEGIFTLAQSMIQIHGFQVDNSRNQSEHLIMLLFNETSPVDKMVSSPAVRIHRRLFKNYNRWCERMGVRPLLLKEIHPVKMHENIVEDILLFLLIWGEAANLRHLPECLCFLFHKVMEQNLAHKDFWSTGSSRSSVENKYPGFFLDMVITPLYEVIAKSVSKGVDHSERKIYDDFNEFFWSPKCLSYRLYGNLDGNIEEGSGLQSSDNIKESTLVSAISAASKTYLEKRSWFHPLYSMNRLFEWHTITFTLLATWAFSSLLQWTYAFTVQVGSIIFLEITLFGILWSCLEVWTLFPTVEISDPSLCGYLIRILAGYLVLVYQTIYFHWSFVYQVDTSLNKLSFYHEGDYTFWWWQYIWLSFMACLFYFIQAMMSVFPSSVSSILEWKNDIVQALLSICYPFSQLYVGKNTSMPQNEVFQYIFYWITLISFKLWFGYRYVVAPVCVPTLELYDDYMNYEKISFLKTATLVFFWWFPHFLVYIIDLSIWYAVWSSITGGLVAINDRLGAVRDSTTFRAHFMRAPKMFSAHYMPTSGGQKEIEPEHRGGDLRSHLSTMSLDQLVVSPRSDQQGTITENASAKPPRTRSAADMDTYDGYQSLSDVELRSFMGVQQQTYGGNSAESKNQEWTTFARIWNELISKLRERDLLSNRERDLLLFTYFPWLSKPIYLPLYQTAGCVENAAIYFKEAAAEYDAENDKQLKMAIIERYISAIGRTTIEAVSEAFEVFSWVLTEVLGNLHREDCDMIFNSIYAWAHDSYLFGRVAGDQVTNILSQCGNIATTLRAVASKRKANPIVTNDMIAKPTDPTESSDATGSRSFLKKSVSTGFLSSLEGDDKDNKFAKLQPFRKLDELVDHTRDKLREEIKAILNTLRNSLKNNKSPNAILASQKLTFILNLKTGFFGNDLYASKSIDILCKDSNALPALSKLEDLVKLRITQVEIKSHEANRRLNFFMNSLYMDAPKLPGSRYCREYTCITPYYSEDILLTKADLLAQNSDKVSVILYLQTLYKDDWVNFLERRGIDESQIWSANHIQYLRIWASCRAQTLYRTVEGMMYTETALKLLAELEQLKNPEVDLLGKLKFNYVVACQVYGVFKKNQDSKADDIEFLLAKYPNLRVAYIDTHRLSATETYYYSVLVKCEPRSGQVAGKEDPDFAKDAKERIKEVFRVKLPGNPVLGEGKPENQNHAIIFTRGRYLQAIDMNQDGYFEEALKMRALLEEFNDQTAIIGFREHIFTGSVSSVANYMALQELSFVTLGQRVLNRPLRIRQHYGHPDIFDKFFVMTEGGMSKASRGINLSEDVFAGFNATIRGYQVGFVEYVQVGKGRDVGLQQTYKFEAKLSQGNAEQSISRDVSRIANRLDFFRLFSYYYGGIGHYLSNALVMFTLVIVVYTMVALALYGEEGVNGRPAHPEGVFQLLLAGMGILQTLPLAVTLTVEKGLVQMLSEISFMILSGGPLYFIFHIQTKCYYFSQTLLAGGAMYRPTGRGFVTRHSPFEENFRFFASSHIYLGFELMVALVLFWFYTKSKQYAGLTWSLWLAAVSFVIGPFWFNPLSFEWSRIQDDYSSWLRWMAEIGGNADQSWEAWWREENSFYQKLSTTWKLFLVCQKCFLWLFISAGIAGSHFFSSRGEQWKMLEVVGVMVMYFAGQAVLSKFEKNWTYASRRLYSLILATITIGCLISLYVKHPRVFLYSLALYYFGAAITFLLLLSGQVPLVMRLYKLHDYVVGHFIFTLLAVSSLFQLGYLQTWLLYHNALSRGVEIEDILSFARKTREKATLDNDNVIDLRNKILLQEKKIQELLELKNSIHGEKVSLTAAAPAFVGGYGTTGISRPVSDVLLPSGVTTPAGVKQSPQSLRKETKSPSSDTIGSGSTSFSEPVSTLPAPAPAPAAPALRPVSSWESSLHSLASESDPIMKAPPKPTSAKTVAPADFVFSQPKQPPLRK